MSSAKFSLKEFIAVITVASVAALNVFIRGAVTVALPSIGKDLHFQQADLQWPLNVYALTCGCLLLFFGRVGDILGPKMLFLVGTVWLAIWSLPSAFAPSAPVFIAFMALQGLGGAANTPATVSILSLSFESGPRRNKAFGFLGAGQPLGYILGLIFGGILADSPATWRAIFYIQTFLALALCVLGWFSIDNSALPTRYTKGLDWGGAFLCTAGVALLTYSVAEPSTSVKGWATPHVIALLITSIILLVAFVFYERWREARDKAVLIPMSVFSVKTSAILAIGFFGFWNFHCLSYFVTLYYQQVNLLNPLQSSLRFIPMTISGVIVNVVTGYALGYMSGYWPVIIGLIASMASSILFALINVNASYWASAFLVMIFLVGVDVFYVVGTIQIVAGIPEDSQSLAGGLFNVVGRISMSVGLAASSTVASSISQKYFQNLSVSDKSINEMDSPKVLMVGYRAAGWTCFTAAVLALIIAAIFTRNIELKSSRRTDVDKEGTVVDDKEHKSEATTVNCEFSPGNLNQTIG